MFQEEKNILYRIGFSRDQKKPGLGGKKEASEHVGFRNMD